jgi:hypothetical protein
MDYVFFDCIEFIGCPQGRIVVDVIHNECADCPRFAIWKLPQIRVKQHSGNVAEFPTNNYSGFFHIHLYFAQYNFMQGLCERYRNNLVVNQ